ncbi:hypothetical protein [Kitasatospora viridis]|uniref:Uncharacterized protein n=1 Tax=Kitasatospora viridis TaxID=281105 RepID=A0A561T6R7_9ACTN|nr:hypothetical protein [Kitasatospora viridis]TWF82798.1 hypothetical protein FHX73_14280 [Kitasatospora viridis]
MTEPGTTGDDGKQNPLTVVKVLWCGQGQLVLVEIYNDGTRRDEADFLALINCGGEKRYAQAALDYVQAKVGHRHRKLLNLIAFTSLDEQSTNLLGALGSRLKAVGATVLSVLVPGSRWTGSGPEAVQDLLELLGFPLGDVEFAGPNQSDYLTGEPTWIAEHNGTYVRILATDNRASVRATALVIENGRLAVVLPGQLTLPLMRTINRIPNLATRIPADRALVLPNRSVLETAVSARRANPDDWDADEWAVIEDFAATVRPQEICVSAGVDNVAGIPAAGVIDLFRPTLTADAAHDFVCFDLWRSGDIFGSWRTVNTTKRIRTTVKTYGAHDSTTYGDIELSCTLRPLPIDTEP